MRKPVFLLTLPMAALLAAQAPVGAVEMPGWVPFFGKKEQPPQNTAPSAHDEASAADALARGESLESAGNIDEAIKVYKDLVKTNGFSAAAPKAQFHLGKALERKSSYKDAFKAYTDYTTKYPRGGDFDAVIQAQFDIAKFYLTGLKPKKLLGIIKTTSNASTAQEMFEAIVKRAPFHKLAPLAQFNVGQALEKQTKTTEAIGAYQEVITRYPGDPVADDAQYQIGYVQFHEAKDGSYDQNARVRAREAFEDFVNRYPNSEKVAQAKQNIQDLGSTDVKGTLGIAKFYDKTKNYKAAVVYYNEVIRVSPSSPESGEARKRIDELKTLVGVDALRSGPEKTQSGETALAKRRAQARVDVASRPDYNGPIVPYPTLPGEGQGRPNMRTSPVGPIVEPPLPAGDPLQGGTAAPIPGLGDTLPPLPGDTAKPAPQAAPANVPATDTTTTPAPATPTDTPATDKPSKTKKRK
jgi:outer membrane protein assembly factor BamD